MIVLMFVQDCIRNLRKLSSWTGFAPVCGDGLVGILLVRRLCYGSCRLSSQARDRRGFNFIIGGLDLIGRAGVYNC